MGFRNTRHVGETLRGARLLAGTIIGAVIETASAGQRVVLDNLGIGFHPRVGFYTGNAGEIRPGEIDGYSIFGAGILEEASPDFGGGQAVLQLRGGPTSTRIVAQATVVEVAGVLSADGDVHVNGVLTDAAGTGAPGLLGRASGHVFTFEWTGANVQIWVDGILVRTL